MPRVSGPSIRLVGSALLVLAIGCSDPFTSLLPVGVTVVITDGGVAPVQAWLVRPGPVPPEDRERVELAAGTLAVVVRDMAVEAPKEPSLRLTRVRLKDGPRSGTEVDVARYKLRPPH